jgi:hypothetical protein
MSFIHKYKTDRGEFYQVSGQSSPISEVLTISPETHEKSIPAGQGRLTSVIKALKEAFEGKGEPEEQEEAKKATLAEAVRHLASVLPSETK